MNLLYSLLFIVLWASGAFFVKNGLKFATPLDFLILRTIIAMSVISIITSIQWKKLVFPTSWRAWVYVVLTGFFLQFLYQYFFFKSLQTNLSPGLLMIILGIQPIFTAFLTHEKMHLQQWSALSITLLGLVLIVYQSLFQGHISAHGILFSILCLSGITVGSILQNKFCRTYSLTANLLIQYAVSLFCLYTINGLHFLSPDFQFHTAFLIPLLWMSLIISVIAIYIYYFLISSKKLTRVTMIFYGVPAAAALFDYLFFGNTVSPLTIMGMLLTFVGLYLTYL